MIYLILILIPLTLLVGLFALNGYEMQRGIRLFALQRARLDKNVERVSFILTHVNFGSFLREEMHLIARHIVHNIAHLSLIAVRATERFLTRLVRYLRSQHAVNETPRENAREFVKTLSDFKGHLEETRPEVPDVLE